MDLDFFLKWVTGRNLAALGALVVAVWAAEALQEYPRALYERWRYPAQRAESNPQGEAIARELDVQESVRLRVLHKRVSAEIAAAAAAGRKVQGLQRLADAALALDSLAYRKTGFEKLNEVRLKIPRAAGPRVVSPDDERFDIPPDVRGRATRTGR